MAKIPGSLKPDDPRLIDYIREAWIDFPRNGQSGAELRPSKGESGQAVVVDRILKGQRGGFFIEAGAFDGEYLSNTLFFELNRNWTGLLVEPNSIAYRVRVAQVIQRSITL